MTASSSGGPSLINIFLLYLSLMGLGAVGGYGSFYWLFSERCSQLMNETEEKHSSSRQQFQQKYEDALEGQRQCMADSSTKKELSELQGRLEAQSSLADRHQNLLQKQEDTLTKLSEIQTAQEATSNTVAALREEMAQTKAELAEANRKVAETLRSTDSVETGLRTDLDAAHVLLDRSTQDVTDMTQQLNQCDTMLPIYRDEGIMMKDFIRTRNHQQCKMEYGKGPFIVTFTLNFPETMGPKVEPNTFDVELAPLSTMPHSIFTFLDLVDLQLFDGTAFVAANANIIEGGSPNTAEAPQSVKLYERYAKFGYNRSPLAFNEYTEDFPHTQFTIGFKGNPVAGPTLAINLADATATRGPNENGLGADPCFGKVVSGFDTLQRIHEAPRAADGFRLALNVDIETVRLNKKKKALPQQQQGEAAQQ